MSFEKLNFKKKYLLYKKKYINLKKQSGGASPEVIRAAKLVGIDIDDEILNDIDDKDIYSIVLNMDKSEAKFEDFISILERPIREREARREKEEHRRREAQSQSSDEDLAFKLLLEDSEKLYAQNTSQSLNSGSKPVGLAAFKPQSPWTISSEREGLSASADLLRTYGAQSKPVGLAESRDSLRRTSSPRDGASASADLLGTTAGDTFYIYTSGMGDLSGAYGEPLPLLEIWLDRLCSNITRNIPANFKNIIISHFDPISLIGEEPPAKGTKKFVDIDSAPSRINRRLIEAKNSLDRRITRHTFSKELFPLKLERPHIVIDMAHLFGYNTDHTVHWANYYGGSDQLYGKSFDMRMLYISWGDFFNFATKQILRITEDGHVITYIDRLIDLGFITEYCLDPSLLITDIILGIIKTKLDIIRRKLGINLDLFDDEFKKITDNLIKEILDKLFDRRSTKEDIEDPTKYQFYTKFNREVFTPLHI